MTRTTCFQIIGTKAIPVTVVAEPGKPGLEIRGLSDAQTRETAIRVRSTLSACNIESAAVVTVSPPVPGKTAGLVADLAIAVAVAAAMKDFRLQEGVCYQAEIALSGDLRPCRGIVAAALAAQTLGDELVVARDNAAEIGPFAAGSQHYAETFAGVLFSLQTNVPLPQVGRCNSRFDNSIESDFCNVQGCSSAKRALEIAAAGGHAIMLDGAPNSGKTMLARRVAGILPVPTDEERLAISCVMSCAGLPLPAERPFRAPHHTVSETGMTGLGEHARPGEVTLSDHGVLFLDELGEFRRSTIESVACALRNGACEKMQGPNLKVRLPCGDAMLICADSHSVSTGACSDRSIDYARKLGVQIWARSDCRELSECDPSAVVRARVEKARAKQMTYRGKLNANASRIELDATNKWESSPTNTLRVARTIADLAGADCIEAEHINEAAKISAA